MLERFADSPRLWLATPHLPSTVLDHLNSHGEPIRYRHAPGNWPIAAYQQIIERAHTHGIQVIGCTLTPYEGATYQRETGEAVRAAVNTWIRIAFSEAAMNFLIFRCCLIQRKNSSMPQRRL